MSFVIADRVKETTATAGTGTLTLAGAATGFQSFAAGVGAGNTCPYVLLSGNGADWEVGTATIGGAGPYTLARTTISASSNSGAAISLSGTSTVFCGETADSLSKIALWQSAAYSTTVDLAHTRYMPQQVVGAAITFTVGATAAGGTNYLEIVADGVHAPTFSGFQESGVSAGYNNTAGIPNQVSFWHDGLHAWFAVAQQINALAYPMLQSATITTGTATLALLYQTALNATAPAASAFAVAASGGAVSVSSVAIAGDKVSLSLSRSISAGETVTASYVVPGTNPIQSTGGLAAFGFSGQAVTLSAFPDSSGQPIQLSLLGASATQSADATYAGYYDYACASQSTYQQAGSACSSVGIPASTDGFFGFILGSPTTNAPILGMATSAAAVSYTGIAYGVYLDTSSHPYYQCVTSGTGQGAPDTQISGSANDVVRLRRITASSQIVAEVSQNGGSTWSTIKTWSGASTAKLYMDVVVTSNSALLAAYSSAGVA